MKHCLNIYTVFALAVLVIIANAQTGSNATKHYEKAGLAFDFPAQWKLTDKSTGDVQYVVVASEDGAVQIAISAQLGSEQQCDFEVASTRITDALIRGVATQIQAGSPLQTRPLKTRVGVLEIDGIEFHGLMNNRRVTSEVYSLRLNLRFVNLVYLRVDDDARGQQAWESIRTTLKLGAPVFKAAAAQAGVPGNPNVLNGRALHLDRPAYPAIAKQAHASGTVVVEVIIDEAGNVISAHPVSGHPLLRASSAVAARGAKFSPTKLCGEPVRVSGVIKYNFVAR